MNTPQLKRELKELAVLGRRFASRHMYREALSLLRLGVQLDPADDDLRKVLTDVLRRASPADYDPRIRDGERATQEVRRDTIDAAHFVGLARFYVGRGEEEAAIECLELAKSKASMLPGAYKLLGTILASQKNFEGAAEQYRKALRFDPFDLEVAESLGTAEYERKNYRAALAATIDAFLLNKHGDQEAANRLKRRVRTLKRILDLDNQELIELFGQRRQRLTTGFDRLQWRRERFLEEKGLLDKGIRYAIRRHYERGGARINLAGHLRAIKLWSDLSDDAIFRLTEVVREEDRRPGSVIFVRGTEGRDVYIVNAGEVVLQRPTPYGTFPLRIFTTGSLFGEVNFVLPVGRSGDAVVVKPSHLMTIDAEKLSQLIEDAPDLGVELFSSFWHGLSYKLRRTNDRLKSFFPSESIDALPQNLVPLGATPLSSDDSVPIDPKDKIRLFREQGLSGKELMTLAHFSKEKHIPAGEHLFHEGDQGDQMYIVLEGQVRISKFIPGAGEEALAILGRGDFFGEMALIEGQERSADAQAHGGLATVLALDQTTVQEVLTMDPRSSLDFLQLLCRLLAKRLREIDGKIVAWHILSGQRSGDMELESLRS